MRIFIRHWILPILVSTPPYAGLRNIIMPTPLPSNVQSGISSGAYVPSPTSPVDIAGDAFFNTTWAFVSDASLINDPNAQTQVNKATLYLKDNMSFVLSASPIYGGNIVAATTAYFSDLQAYVSTGAMDVIIKSDNDLISIEQNAKAGFGSSASVMSVIFGAMGLVDYGAPGLQSGQQFGQSLGASMDSANPPTASSTAISSAQIYAVYPY
jgi:hypothetical protein